MTPESAGTVYEVSFTDVALAEADAAYLRRSRSTSPEEAAVWYEGIFKKAGELYYWPRRGIRFCRSAVLEERFAVSCTGKGETRTTLSTVLLTLPMMKPKVLCAFFMSAMRQGKPVAGQQPMQTKRRTERSTHAKQYLKQRKETSGDD